MSVSAGHNNIAIVQYSPPPPLSSEPTTPGHHGRLQGAGGHGADQLPGEGHAQVAGRVDAGAGRAGRGHQDRLLDPRHRIHTLLRPLNTRRQVGASYSIARILVEPVAIVRYNINY